MAARWLGCFLLLILLWETNCQGPPKVTGSYKAMGEMVQRLEDESGLLTQVAFEETYDAETQNAAFDVWIMGLNVTFIENFKTNQTFRFNGTDCVLMTVKEWINTKSPPSLMAYEDTNGTVRFSLKQLFSLSDKLLVEKNVSSVFRGIPARKWMYEIKGTEPESGAKRIISIYAYWSVSSWSTTSNEETVPLGYVVSKMIYKSKKKMEPIHEQFINVYGFVPGAVERKHFEPIQGVECAGRVQTLKFPDVSRLQALALHSEILFPDYLEIKYADTWLDTKNKFVRSDLERIKDQVPSSAKKSLKYQSEIAIGEMGVVFIVVFDKGMYGCGVIPFKDYEFDIQNLFNYQLPLKDWQTGKLFGLNDTKYVYTGRTSKRNIPCYVFQGIRKDWPYPGAKVTSIWDWCFSLNITQKDQDILFQNGEYGLVNVQIKILESGIPADFPPGFRIIHHFYDINMKDPALMDATNFDISRCYDEHEKRYLQFVVDWTVTDDNLQLIENATSDVNFLQKWKAAIYENTEMQPYTLRITKVQSVVSEKKLYVKFVLLAPHDGLPDDIKKTQKTGFAAENLFRNKVNEGNVFINYIPSKKSPAMKLFVLKHSVEFQISNQLKPHTLPPTTQKPSTFPLTFPFSLITEPEYRTTSSVVTDGDRRTSSSGTTIKGQSTTNKEQGSTDTTTFGTTPKTKEIEKEALVGHAAGTVAAVSVSMLMVGMTIGSAGTFIKFNGLPAFMTRS